ncbi:MAG: hypothetical protein PHU25_04545 [Deltaproteobacteria bacterium]|nr:hypothetical protein [Deltaproteobacteria bacterium]
MTALQIRELDEGVYRVLAEQARRERRSLARQAATILERALLGPDDNRARRRALVERLAGDDREPWPARLPPPAELLREDRRR